MRYRGHRIVFQEIPNEISLAFSVVGCPLRCPGCHSSDLWAGDQGDLLDVAALRANLGRYRGYLTCVLFLGGEWEMDGLEDLLREVHAWNFKTALYTGLDLERVPKSLLSRLDYLKYGSYIARLGALDSRTTNQRLVNLNTGEILNHHFVPGGLNYDSTDSGPDRRQAGIY